ncbi:Na+ dependent nucleoside transporter N-terminal domain-containing protein [Chitinophaga sedimenti]|uniref:Na+ dependent nucleoside transporter N-terminal domain-containing protein n=1 Tax=Chitinophaga sedimenti TaxID=2033606 RepID=UPI00355860A3
MTFHWDNLLRGGIGMLFLVGICYLLSNNRSAINWKLIGMGIFARLCSPSVY